MKIRDGKTRLFILLFILPALIIYTMFQIIPLFGAVYFSLSEWNGIAGSAIEFVGFKNFANIFKDANFILSLKNMAKMVIFSVLFHTPIALLMAVGIYSAKRGGRLFKAIYFVPTVFPLTAVGLLWYFIFMPNGSLNSLLEVVGLKDLVTPWLVNEKTAMNTIIFVNIWAGLGYYMVILLAGLSTISNDVYEAAALDGVNPVTKFFYITVPLLKPIIKMCILMDIIGTIKVFDLVFVMTEGGPNGLTNLPTTLMYQEAFKYDHYGTGSAIGIILLIICLVGTLCSELLGSKKES
ncbi:MAG: sugar ABC transporter permease [Clostridiales bacterium]|nr:sugar ABC transporter permease [Clostridiales bacterium]